MKQLLMMGALLSISLLAPAARAQPSTVAYQGELFSSGARFTGVADFKFAILDGLGSTTLWSNDGTSTTGDEPTASLALNVDDGIFSVHLGSTATGQQPLSSSVFDDVPAAYLRVWVDTGSGFEQLSDAPVSSTPFALVADAANRAPGDFLVPQTLSANTVGTDNFVMTTGASPGYVLTTDAFGLGTWQPAPTGGGNDGDWLVTGSDMVANVSGNVGIGTASPTAKLHVLGTSRFEVASGQWIEASTPGGWPGFTAIAPNSHRRDIVFDDQGMRLLVGASSSSPPGTNGLFIGESGQVGVGTTTPNGLLTVNGTTRTQALWVDAYDGSGPRLLLGADPNLGGLLDVRHANTTNAGVTIRGGVAGQGGYLYVHDDAGVANVTLVGDQNYGGRIAVGNGAGDTGFLDGNVGGGAQLRLTNNYWDTTYTVSGQAYSSGSQTRMFDASGTLRQEWTAANSEWKAFGSAGNLAIQTSGAGSGGSVALYQASGQSGVRADGDYVGLGGRIRVYDSTGTESATILGEDSSGGSRVIADVFEVSGGSDLSENFEINGGVEVEPGMVVCIDPDDVGKLVESKQPYQRTVAGIVSGAGGIRPGMLMGQHGTVADGHHPVALTGRVWTWCDASSAPIEPGDLLTTSATPGHAMKVTDHERSNGAILGKAMSRLQSGLGLVLVLVSLQ